MRRRRPGGSHPPPACIQSHFFRCTASGIRNGAAADEAMTLLPRTTLPGCGLDN